MDMDTVSDLLRQKPDPQLHAVSPDTTVAYAVCLMNYHGVGAVLVMKEDRLEGIFTERDVLQRVVEPNRDPGATAVHEVMTPKPRTIKAGDRVARVLDIMARGKFRHLPVMTGTGVVGVLSMRDLNAWLIRKLVSPDDNPDDSAVALAKSMGAAKPGRKSV